MNGIALRHTESEQEVAACFPIMVQLRPHLASAAEFAARIARQQPAGRGRCQHPNRGRGNFVIRKPR
jgi:hypothetical protein